MPIREMLYYMYTSYGFEGDLFNRASRARGSGPAGLAGSEFGRNSSGRGLWVRGFLATPLVADLA